MGYLGKRGLAKVKTSSVLRAHWWGTNVGGELNGWRLEERGRTQPVPRGERAISSNRRLFTRSRSPLRRDRFPHGYLLVHSTHSPV